MRRLKQFNRFCGKVFQLSPTLSCKSDSEYEFAEEVSTAWKGY